MPGCRDTRSASRPPVWTRLLLALAALMLVSTGSAATVLLVHGYLSNPNDWRRAGVVAELGRSGWTDAGTVSPSESGVVRAPETTGGAESRLYTVALPDHAPLQVQAGLLADAVYWVHKRHPNEALAVVGHSAGGVVARLMMVQQPQTRISELISIASPHLGTESANLGVLAGESPLAELAPLLGAGKFTQSLGLYQDLVLEHPGSLLYWLNRQDHPPARYVCAVRENDGMDLGELVVPAWSQDLNQVQALQGRAERHVLSGYHGLSETDGKWLADILGSGGI